MKSPPRPTLPPHGEPAPKGRRRPVRHGTGGSQPVHTASSRSASFNAETSVGVVSSNGDPEVVSKAKPPDMHGLARSLTSQQPALLEFMLAAMPPLDHPPAVDQRAPACAALEKASPDTQKRCGAMGQTPHRFSVQAEKNAWRLTAEDLRSSTGIGNAPSEQAAQKIAAAARFIDSFPSFNKEDIFLSSREKNMLKKDSRSNVVKEHEKRLMMGELNNEILPYEPEPNRLDDSLTEVAVREVCDAIYDLMAACGGHGVGKDQDLVIGCVEATLMAWDLASEIQGAWRVPLTIVTDFRGRRYSYVCVLIHHGDRVAALGRCALKQLSHIPLARQRASDVVSRFASAFVRRGHELRTIYLGLPTKCPTPSSEAQTRPLVWRYLKLSCIRQEWMSVLATIDLYFAHRCAIRQALVLSLGSTALPGGFAPLETHDSKPRLKAVPPTRKQKQRSRQRSCLPPLGHPDQMVSDVGAWKATQDELRIALFGNMNIEGAGDMEDCSSVSSASLDEIAEDRALDYFEAVPTEDLQTIAQAKGHLARNAAKFLVGVKQNAKNSNVRSSSGDALGLLQC